MIGGIVIILNFYKLFTLRTIELEFCENSDCNVFRPFLLHLKFDAFKLSCKLKMLFQN